MLTAMSLPHLSDLGVIGTLLIAVIGGYFVVKARKGTAEDNEAVKTATLMTGQIAALESEQRVAAAHKATQDAEIGHLRDLLAEKDKMLDRNSRDIVRLTEMVTQQAAVSQFRDEAFKWFEVIAEALDADPPQFPDHIPEPV